MIFIGLKVYTIIYLNTEEFCCTKTEKWGISNIIYITIFVPFRIPRSSCTRSNYLSHHPPKHCWDFARYLPRIETWIFKTWITDVWQTKKTRSNPIDPRPSRCPRQNFLRWIRLQPSSHRNLRNLQKSSPTGNVVNPTSRHGENGVFNFVF